MFHGSMVALVTPLKNDEVDVEALRALVEFHIQHETSAIIAAGTTGEAGTLSYAEKCLVIKTVVDAAKERIPVIAGTAANSTKACIELTEYALSAGAHGALIMTPAYIKPTQEGLFQHYTHIANRIPMPIIPYNVPHRTGCDLLPETVIRLAAHSNIIGIKEATGQLSRLKSILDGAEGRLDVYSGDDVTAAEWMLAGAKGVISVTANIVPRKMAKLSEAALDGQRELCISINEKLAVLNELLFVESNPIPTKWAMARLGLIHDEIRLPLTPLSAIHHAKLAHELLNLGLLKS